MKSKIILLLLSIFVLSNNLNAQKRYRNGVHEFGAFIGGSNYFGDIAPEISLNEFNLCGGLMYKYHHNSFLSSRYQATYAKISGSDKNFNSNSYRNITFFSPIVELGYSCEFNFKPFGINVRESSKTFYLVGGVNMFYFDPKAELPSGDIVDLRRFGTEGQFLDGKKKTYSRIQPNLLMGFGLKQNFGKGNVVGIELAFRKTFTDYLDDTKNNYPSYALMNASKGGTAAELSHPHTLEDRNPPATPNTMRGDKHLQDWYFTVGITISFRNVTTFCPSTY